MLNTITYTNFHCHTHYITEQNVTTCWQYNVHTKCYQFIKAMDSVTQHGISVTTRQRKMHHNLLQNIKHGRVEVLPQTISGTYAVNLYPKDALH